MLGKVTPLLLIIVIASLIGFMTENIWIGARYGYWDNRGMILPALLGYGIAIVGIYLLFGLPQQPTFFGRGLHFSDSQTGVLYYYLATGILVSVGEVVLGTFVEKNCGIVWWNYTEIPMHIGKYTSVPTSMGFAAMITLFMGEAFPRLYDFVLKIQSPVIDLLAMVLLMALIADFLFAANYMMKNKKLNERWQVKVSHGALAVSKEQNLKM